MQRFIDYIHVVPLCWSALFQSSGSGYVHDIVDSSSQRFTVTNLMAELLLHDYLVKLVTFIFSL